MADPHGSGSGHAWEPDLHLANERMAERHRAALDERTAPSGVTGPVGRLRNVVGARLIAIGTSLAASDRPMVRRPARRP